MNEPVVYDAVNALNDDVVTALAVNLFILAVKALNEDVNTALAVKALNDDIVTALAVNVLNEDVVTSELASMGVFKAYDAVIAYEALLAKLAVP